MNTINGLGRVAANAATLATPLLIALAVAWVAGRVESGRVSGWLADRFAAPLTDPTPLNPEWSGTPRDDPPPSPDWLP